MKETRNKLSGNYNEAQRLHLSIPEKAGTTGCHPGRNTNYCCGPDSTHYQRDYLRPDMVLSTLQQWPWRCNAKTMYLNNKILFNKFSERNRHNKTSGIRNVGRWNFGKKVFRDGCFGQFIKYSNLVLAWNGILHKKINTPIFPTVSSSGFNRKSWFFDVL